jgi:hypothetical protein
VIEQLRAAARALPPDDGVAVFNAMYLDVTERIAAELEAGVFEDAGFMAELDVRFARLWLAAYDADVAGRKVPSAWAPLFEERTTPGILRVQYALAGMNSHIEHDLPLAVVETCRSRDVDLGHRSVRRDYDEVNDILAAVESEVRRGFLTRIGQRLDDEIGPLVHLISAWNIDKARDLAWVSAETIWATRELEFLSTRFVAALGHTVGMTSRYLLTALAGAGLVDESL